MTKNYGMLMAYAIGMTGEVKKNPESHHVSVDLEQVNDDWKDYRLVHYYVDEKYNRLNDSYALFYNGTFGKSNNCSSLIHIDDGFELSHIVHLILQTIGIHQAELREKEKEKDLII